MVQIVIETAVVKGYHEFQIRPPIDLPLPVTKEYGNKHDPYACLVWVPELDSIPFTMWFHVTDIKRGETVQTIAVCSIEYTKQSCYIINKADRHTGVSIHFILYSTEQIVIVQSLRDTMNSR